LKNILVDALPSIGEEAHLNENEGTAAVNVATTEITAAENKTKYPTGCSLEQFQCWQKTRPWLYVTDDGKVKCDVCAKISSLELHTDIGQHTRMLLLWVQLLNAKIPKVTEEN
jgi:hypothetical protein